MAAVSSAGGRLRTVMPKIRVQTQRVRLSLAVADAPEAPVGETVVGSDVAVNVARAVIGDEITECVLAIFLDARCRVTGYTEVVRGTLNAARLTPRDIFVPALLANAHAVIVVHNHPSGTADPSRADRSVTYTLRSAAHLIGVPLIDHLIVTATGHYSFAVAEAWE